MAAFRFLLRATTHTGGRSLLRSHVRISPLFSLTSASTHTHTHKHTRTHLMLSSHNHTLVRALCAPKSVNKWSLRPLNTSTYTHSPLPSLLWPSASSSLHAHTHTSKHTQTHKHTPKHVHTSARRMQPVKRPLSPHVTIYDFPITAYASILHRVTGVVLTAGVCACVSVRASCVHVCVYTCAELACISVFVYVCNRRLYA